MSDISAFHQHFMQILFSKDSNFDLKKRSRLVCVRCVADNIFRIPTNVRCVRKNLNYTNVWLFLRIKSQNKKFCKPWICLSNGNFVSFQCKRCAQLIHRKKEVVHLSIPSWSYINLFRKKNEANIVFVLSSFCAFVVCLML